jgi:signal peptidase
VYKFFKAVIALALVVILGLIAFIYFSDAYSVYIVKSDSMKPVFASGDLVVTGRPGSFLAGDVAPGKIITFERNGELVTHRIVSLEGDTIRTRGDAQEDIDSAPVSRFFDVKGCYICHIPYLGRLSVFLKTRLGWFLCVIIPALGLVAFLIRDIIKEARQCMT